MAHQREIQLAEEQRETIKATIQEAQSAFLDYQWDLQAESTRMGELLSANPVDETAVLAQADRVMGLETKIKKTQLSLLIRIKNALTETQQEKLFELRAKKESGQPPPKP
jgi:Spy/CpxP family protein refolding chaperone